MARAKKAKGKTTGGRASAKPKTAKRKMVARDPSSEILVPTEDKTNQPESDQAEFSWKAQPNREPRAVVAVFAPPTFPTASAEPDTPQQWPQNCKRYHNDAEFDGIFRRKTPEDIKSMKPNYDMKFDEPVKYRQLVMERTLESAKIWMNKHGPAPTSSPMLALTSSEEAGGMGDAQFGGIKMVKLELPDD